MSSWTETPDERHYRLLREINANLLAEAVAVLEALQLRHDSVKHHPMRGECDDLCDRIEPLRAVIRKAGGERNEP